jgi:hypothetical protein
MSGQIDRDDALSGKALKTVFPKSALHVQPWIKTIALFAF